MALILNLSVATILLLILAGLIVHIRKLSKEVQQSREIEAALKKSEQRFRSLFDGAPVPLCFVGRDDEQADFNKRFTQTFGFTANDAPTLRNWWPLAYPDPVYRQQVIESWETAVRQAVDEKTDMAPVEYRVTCKDGSVRTVLVSGIFLDEDFLSVSYDITERKQAEMALAESEERYRSLIMHSPDAIFVVQQDRIILANYACQKLFGAGSPEELLSKHILDLYHPDSHKQICTRIQQLQAPHDPVSPIEGKIIRLDSSVVDVEILADSLAFNREDAIHVILRDITLRKQMEKERERLMAAIEQVSEIIFVTDPEGKIQYVNPAFETVTGYSREEVMGANPRIFKSGNHDELFYHDLWGTIASGRIWKGRIVNKRKNGKLFTEEATISPVTDPSGRIINYVAVKRDITEHLHLAAQFEHAQKMESVGRLAGGVAHDFNNMLSVILGYSELALDKMKPSEPLYGDLKEIFDAAKRSSEITRQLLAFARKATISPKPIDLNETIEGMLKMLRRLIGENISLAWIPQDDLWSVMMDTIQIDQILANLCLNARDAIADIGEVIIETENIIFDETYCVTHAGYTPGEYVRLTISDDGCGMDKQTLERIFEPFFTTKKTGHGSGLGLATIYGIVKQNNGFINVYSEPGEGTAFKIYLPRHAGQAVESKMVLEGNVPQGHGETILLVEDEVSILNMTKKMLASQSYNVLVASTLGEAMRIASEYPGPIHLLITDVIMPEINGKDLMQRIMKFRPELRCLYMSGYTANVIAHKGVLDEGVHFVQKPFSMEVLTEKIKAAMA